MTWSPSTWRKKQLRQMPVYDDAKLLSSVEERLSAYPPLVFAGEARCLIERLSKVVEGKNFLLQGGDCAESFSEHTGDNIRNFFCIFLQMAAVLMFATSSHVVKLGRIAGQFAKPRSNDFEEIDGVRLPSYRGDIINSIEFNEKARKADPEAQIKAYRQSAATLNLLRAFAYGGYASLEEIHNWRIKHIHNNNVMRKYENIARSIEDVMSFIAACGINGDNSPALRETEFFTCHEALLLGYEQALTRVDSTTKDWYATSGHFLWIGDRTRQIDGAHVEYCRGIKNPIGIKCGPSLKTDELLKLCDILNPQNQSGRLTLICRFGKEKVEKYLPKLINAIEKEGNKVIWCCDPMHGNTIKTETGYKTRRLDDIFAEVENFINIHNAIGTYPGGVHLEMTGKDVTECVGGVVQVTEKNLSDRYHTHCDPRLNASQSLEVAFMIADKIKNQRGRRQMFDTAKSIIA